MRWDLVLLTAAGWAALGAGAVRAQGLESITVTGDPVHLLETRASDTAFGLDKPQA